MTSSLPSPQEAAQELLRRRQARRDPAYFIAKFCRVYDATSRDWLPFELWDSQSSTLQIITDEHLVVVLKARQLGLTWLVLGYSLWLMLARPGSTVLLFSQRDTEAIHLLDFRLKGMFDHLPAWLKPPVVKDSAHEWRLANGSAAMAFPTTGGRSYTASLAIVDEADFAPDLNQLMNAVKPTIDAGGRMILVSTVDKSQPQSEFKRIYRGARAGESAWRAVFLPWSAHPGRTPEWYADKQRDVMSRTGSLDDVQQEYPSTDTEALAPKAAQKRIPAAWLEQCYRPAGRFPDEVLKAAGAPALPGLEVYALPVPGRRYVIGCDPAEGNPTSDDSALAVLDFETGEEMAALAGKYQPSTLAAHVTQVAAWYNRADVLVERNNHGHAVLLWLRDNSTLRKLPGHDTKEGWLSNSKGKALLYDGAADAFRDNNTILHSFLGYTQLASIEGSTLLAPDGEHDDRADAYALALQARIKRPGGAGFML